MSILLAGRCRCGMLPSLCVCSQRGPYCEKRAGRPPKQKRCHTCRYVKPAADFYRCQDGRLRFECKTCHHARVAVAARTRYRTDPVYRARMIEERRLDRSASPALREWHRAKWRAFHARHREERNAKSRRSHALHRETRLAAQRRRYLRTRRAKLAAARAYYQRNRERILAQKAGKYRATRKAA